MEIKAFTIKAQGLLRELKTQCGVSSAYIPKNGEAHPHVESCIALWDTGATGTAITKELAEKLNLPIITQVKSYHANGESMVNVYAINILLPNGVGYSFLQVTEGKLTGMDVLIGMDVISTGDFSISNLNGKTTFSFRIPSSQELDFVDQYNKEKLRTQYPKAHTNTTMPKKKRKK